MLGPSWEQLHLGAGFLSSLSLPNSLAPSSCGGGRSPLHSDPFAAWGECLGPLFALVQPSGPGPQSSQYPGSSLNQSCWGSQRDFCEEDG